MTLLGFFVYMTVDKELLVKKILSGLFGKSLSVDGMEQVELCQQEAESLYRTGKYHCAEAILEVIRKHFRPDLQENIVYMVSGFGGGSGSGCICGAVSGATVAIGLVLQEDKKGTARLTGELHKWFKQKHGVTCCRTIRSNNKIPCPVLTGEVAGKTAELLLNKLK